VERAISVIYSECVSVALGIQNAMRMRLSAMCGVRLYIIFPNYFINGKISEESIEHEAWTLIFSTMFVWNVFNSKMYWARNDENV
jgi:hypothetical protein